MLLSPSPSPTPPASDAPQDWLGQIFSSLNAEGNNSWMHTLLDGLASAVIGALVALAVVLLTVKAQNAGIDEQLRTQRRENVRAREHAAAAELLRTLQGIQDAVGRSRVKKTDEGIKVSNLESVRDALPPLYADLRVGLERLRLDLKDEDDEVIDAFGNWARDLEHRAWFYLQILDSYADNEPETRPPGTFVDLRDQLVSVLSSIQFMSTQIVAYVRSDDDARKEAAAYLDEARIVAGDVDMQRKSQVEYYNKYLRRPGDSESPEPQQQQETEASRDSAENDPKSVGSVEKSSTSPPPALRGHVCVMASRPMSRDPGLVVNR